MDVNWNDPDIVSLHERLAACIQQQLEDDMTEQGRVGDMLYFGARAATEIFSRALGVDVMGSSGEWTLAFAADPPPSTNYVIGCATCGCKELELHKDYCYRKGVLRQAGAKAEL